MWNHHLRRGFTWKELIAILAFLAIVLGILFPAVQQARERARRNECSNNLKQIGLGLQCYYDARKIFPPSADPRGQGPKIEAGGWSFLFKILPNLQYDSIYSSIYQSDIHSTTIDPLKDNGTLPTGSSGANAIAYARDDAVSEFLSPSIPQINAIAYARDNSIREFLCPSNPNQIFYNPGAPTTQVGKKHAVTNYKAMGATSIESLLVSLNPDSPPPYGDKTQHPDGVLFPGTSGLKMDDIKDGLANTIMVVETVDFKASTWIAGCDVNLAGMNKASSYFKFQDQKASYWAPLGFNGNFYRGAAPSIQSQKPFTAFDYCSSKMSVSLDGKTVEGLTGKDVGTYPAGVGRTPDYGPSSGHANVVNHLFCDGSVRGIRKDVDYAVYFLAITRDGGDSGANNEIE